MKNYKMLLTKYPLAVSFLIFNLLFKLSMYTSKTVHALFFDHHGGLSNYGLSYSAMAFAGMFAAYIGKKTEQFNKKRVMQIGLLAYAIGILLRVFPNSPMIAIISGFIAGIGASTVMLLMRIWIVNIGTESERSTVVSLKEVIDEVGSSLGTFLSGILVAILSWYFNHTLQMVLIIASLLCFLAIKFVPDLEDEVPEETTEEERLIKSNHVDLKIGTIAFGIIMGLSVSLFGPYLPIILKNQGVNVSLIGMILTSLGIASMYFASLFSGDKTSKYKQYIFLSCEIMVGIISLLFIIQMNIIYLIVLLFARLFFMNGSVITQELMELDMYPKKEIAYFYGLSQTSYFIGDAVGGILGGYLFAYSVHYTLIIFCMISIVNAVLLFVFYHYIMRKKSVR